MIYFSYVYFFCAFVVLVVSTYHATIHGDYSFISDIRTINNTFLGILLLSLDYDLQFTNLVDKVFQMCTRKKNDFLKDVSSEVMTEVD